MIQIIIIASLTSILVCLIFCYIMTNYVRNQQKITEKAIEHLFDHIRDELLSTNEANYLLIESHVNDHLTKIQDNVKKALQKVS